MTSLNPTSSPCTAQEALRPRIGSGVWSTLRGDFSCVFSRDPAARNWLEVLTIYPGVHAVLWHRVAHRFWKMRLFYVARLISFLARLFTHIDIHPRARIGQRFFIDHGTGVVIGETAEIGDDVTLYHGVTLGGTSWNAGKRHPTLGDGVLVGAGAKILGPITIGARCRIAANSVVIEDIPEGMTVVGIPGRPVQPKRGRTASSNTAPLDHNSIPDPIGKAMACMFERIRVLEEQLVQHNMTNRNAGRTCPSEECIDLNCSKSIPNHPNEGGIAP